VEMNPALARRLVLECLPPVTCVPNLQMIEKSWSRGWRKPGHCMLTSWMASGTEMAWPSAGTETKSLEH
jgi:hypothetical protein